MKKKQIPISLRKFFYCMSYSGWAICDRIMVSFALYFYNPSPDRENVGFINLISDKVFGGVLTIFGIIMIFGRIIDAILDPIIANWTDNSKAPMGRRKFYMFIGGLPLPLFTVLIFFPPFYKESWLNAIYLSVVLAGFFTFFTIYVVPYLALIPEISHTDKERRSITTQQALWGLVSAGIVIIGAPILWELFESFGFKTVSAYQYGILVLGILSAILNYIVFFAIDEKKYCSIKPQENVKLFTSLRMTSQNKHFRMYLGGNICFWMAFNMISSSVLYFATVLMKKDESFIAILLALLFGVAIVSFPFINIFCSRFGKKKIIILGLAVFSVLLSLLFFMKATPISPVTYGLITISLMGFSIGTMMIIPNVILSDV